MMIKLRASSLTSGDDELKNATAVFKVG